MQNQRRRTFGANSPSTTRLGTKSPVFRRFRCSGIVGAIACLFVLFALAGCTSSEGTQFAVGDCLAGEVNENGEAEKVACDSENSFTVEKLARNGGSPSCPYKLYRDVERRGRGTAQVSDAVTKTTYCGPWNKTQ